MVKVTLSRKHCGPYYFTVEDAAAFVLLLEKGARDRPPEILPPSRDEMVAASIPATADAGA